MRSCLIHTEEAMVKFGQIIGQAVASSRVITLHGPLGAGKTTIAKGLISAVAGVAPAEVTSPTFQYVQLYTGGDRIIAHFDLFRLHGADEFIDLGLEEYLSNTLAIIEWPDRINTLLPMDTLRIEVEILQEGRRVKMDFDREDQKGWPN